MDLGVQKTELKQGHYSWDLQIEKTETGEHRLVTLQNENELLQRAQVAAFLEYGTIPQLPEVGVPWQYFLTGLLEFGDIDASVSSALRDAGLTDFYADYELKNDGLECVIKKRGEE